ncbi:hypothetical protein WJX74_009973 [Apatococcus lobatus]|uniref:Non-specific serine/threonine protein kinase n=1 Tax=Apatococcus lobatus TaxID=904363 RepID=A0AAW1RXC7_9CHLO
MLVPDAYLLQRGQPSLCGGRGSRGQVFFLVSQRGDKSAPVKGQPVYSGISGAAALQALERANGKGSLRDPSGVFVSVDDMSKDLAPGIYFIPAELESPHGRLQDLLAPGLPQVAVASSSKVHQEPDRRQHPTFVMLWTTLALQARQRFQYEDVQEVALRHVTFNPAGNPLTSRTEGDSVGLFRLRLTGGKSYELADVWNLVVEQLQGRATIDQAVIAVSNSTELSRTSIRNAIHCLGQGWQLAGQHSNFIDSSQLCRLPLRHRGHAGDIAEAAETAEAVAAMQCSASGKALSAVLPYSRCSLMDLHLGQHIARQTLLAMKDGKQVVVRLAFQRRQHSLVNAEVQALTTLRPLQGSHVPCLLGSGSTCKGYSYSITEHINGRQWNPRNQSDRELVINSPQPSHAHDLGVVHGDVKPDNIMVEHGTGRPVFVDFALSQHAVCKDTFEDEVSELKAMLGQADPGWEERANAIVAAIRADCAAEWAQISSPQPPSRAGLRHNHNSKLAALGRQRLHGRSARNLKPAFLHGHSRLPAPRALPMQTPPASAARLM